MNETINRCLSTENFVCTSDTHNFVRIDTFTGGVKYKCTKCGLEAIESNLSGDMIITYLGSYIENTAYRWNNKDMSVNEISTFKITFGNLPIYEITYQDGQLILQNKINGSRDGRFNFPEGYFDKKYYSLTLQQEKDLFDVMNTIDFSLWSVDERVFKNLYACGFCIYESFKCSFNNGKHYISYSPKNGFEKLQTVLCKICNIPSSNYNDLTTSAFE